MMRVSLVLLTYNRADTVARALEHNLATASYPLHELVWVDNGSTDHVRDVVLQYKPDVCVLNKVNLGVSKGYNRGFALATGDYIVITGCDMLMPADWLFTFCAYLIGIPNTGVASMCPDPTGERIESLNGLRYQRSSRFSRIIVPRRLLTSKIGYLREDFGLYGKEDREWGQRAFLTCQREGLLTYTIPGQYPRHLGTMGIQEYDGKDPADYHAFKARETRDPQKREVLRRAATDNYPYFNPYV